MNILIACECSATVREALTSLGHVVMSADIQPCDEFSLPHQHYQGDVRDVLYAGWDMMIGHPPCTYMANSGVSWMDKQLRRREYLYEATSFFKLLWEAPIKRICLENPIMHKHAIKQFGGLKPTQIIQPWMFGHKESKATCLWLKNLPPLRETNNVYDEMMELPYYERQKIVALPPSEDRAKLRSKTYPGIADAIAQQWGILEPLS